MGHPIFARIYAARSAAEAHLQADARRELLDGLSGRVLEVGCGNGLNFAHYPSEVTELVAVEPEPYLRGQAELAAREAPGECRVVDGRAESLSRVVTGPFDAAVFSLVLCTVEDPRAVLSETAGLLRDGADVRFYEHVVSDDPGAARWQRRAAPCWSWVAGGCRPDRDTLSLIGDEFDISVVRRFDFCPGPRFPLAIVAPHLLARGQFHAE